MSKTFKETLQSGCLTLLLIFLVGLGSCVGLIAGSELISHIFNKGDTKSKLNVEEEKFITNLKKNVENNNGTADDYFLYSKIVSAKNPSHITSLEKAISLDSREAKLDYANSLYQEQKNFDKNSSNYLANQKQIFTLTKETMLTGCETFNYINLKPPFYTYKDKNQRFKDKIFTQSYYLHDIYERLFRKSATINNEETLLLMFYQAHCATDYDLRLTYLDYTQYKNKNALIYISALEKLINDAIIPESDKFNQQQEKIFKAKAEKLYLDYLTQYPLEKYPISPIKKAN